MTAGGKAVKIKLWINKRDFIQRDYYISENDKDMQKNLDTAIQEFKDDWPLYSTKVIKETVEDYSGNVIQTINRGVEEMVNRAEDGI